VLLKVYNLGAEDIHEVSVQDKWPKEHFDVSGELTAKFATIEAGSNATHSFTVAVRLVLEFLSTCSLPNNIICFVQAKFEGFYAPDRAAVSYRETAESEPIVGYSNPMHNTSVLPAALYQKLYVIFHVDQLWFCTCVF
jgi:hypothetical protein